MPCLQACCCCSLQTGARFSAIYTLVVSLIAMGMGIWLVIILSDDKDKLEFIIRLLNEVKELRKVSMKDLDNVLTIIAWCLTVTYAVYALASALLLCGVSNNNVCLFWPWLIFTGLSTASHVISVIYFVATDKVSVYYGLGSLVPALITLYFFAVVYSAKQVAGESQVNRFADSAEYPRNNKNISRTNVW